MHKLTYLHLMPLLYLLISYKRCIYSVKNRYFIRIQSKIFYYKKNQWIEKYSTFFKKHLSYIVHIQERCICSVEAVRLFRVSKKIILQIQIAIAFFSMKLMLIQNPFWRLYFISYLYANIVLNYISRWCKTKR